ncbi:MAG TPA: tetratricopeptide repeat protein [Luteitalea sp.]|nr:tetratricopeptide repeat protein [Luteitalea sp.]
MPVLFPHKPSTLVGAVVLALAVSGCSRNAQSYLERGDEYLKTGDLAAAVLEYRNAIEKEPTLGAARVKLAEVYERQGNGAGALAEYVRAADLLPNDAAVQVKAGFWLGGAARFDEAKQRADRALRLQPKNADALVLRANALASLKDLDGALEQMQQALSLDPRSQFRSNLGVIEAARGNLAEAEAAFRQAVLSDPKSVAAQVALGQFLWGAGRAQEAEAAFKAAVQLDASNPLPNRWLAAYYLRTNRGAEAEPYFRKVTELLGTADATVALADYYLSMSRPDDARKVLEKLGENPQYWPLSRVRVADILHTQGKKAEALAAVDEVVGKHPTLVGGHTVRGRMLLAANRADEARTEAQAALKLDPRSVESLFLLGQVEEKRQDLAAAATAYTDLLKINPRASAAQVRLALVQMQRNDLSAAMQMAEQAATAQPDNLQPRLVLARALLARGEVDRSTTITQQLLRDAPNSAVVQNQAGMLALARNDVASARAAFGKALQANPALVEPLSGLVSLDLQARQPQAARARVEQRLTQAPRDPLVLLLAGRTWGATGDAAGAEQYLRRAIEADPSNLEAYGQLGQLYLAQRKMDQALGEFEQMATKQPKAVAPRTMAAMILQSQGKDDEARRRYEQIVGMDPRAAVASNNLAWMYASRGEQLDRALQLAQAAKAEAPDEPEVNDTLAYVYIQKQLPALAIEPLKLAVDKVPSRPAFHYRLGLAYAQTGNKDAARKSLQQALQLQTDFPQAEDARKLLATLN